MTTKEKFIYNLHQAKISHIRWVGMIKLILYRGIDEKESIKLNIVDIDFGKWLYEEAIFFKESITLQTVEDIEKSFIKIHELFILIYEIASSKNRLNLFRNKKVLDLEEKKLVSKYYEDIVVISDKLQSLLRLFDKQLNALSGDAFDKLNEYFEYKNIGKKIEHNKEETINKNISGARGAIFNNIR